MWVGRPLGRRGRGGGTGVADPDFESGSRSRWGCCAAAVAGGGGGPECAGAFLKGDAAPRWPWPGPRPVDPGVLTAIRDLLRTTPESMLDSVRETLALPVSELVAEA